LEELEQGSKNTTDDKIVLVKCPIEREGYKGNSQHPYRIHPKVKLTAVPTLVWWQNDSTSERIVEGDFTNGTKLNNLRVKIAKQL
jgi:hypothetical protein